MSDENDIPVRLTRLEERLISERSVRKTRDDQLFKFISTVHEDLDKHESSLAEISSEVKGIGHSVKILVDRYENQDEMLTKIQTDDEDQKKDINQIKGSINALKFVVPLIITLIGAGLGLLLSNIKMKVESPPAIETKAEEWGTFE